MDKETLQYIANSDIWDKIRDDILLPKIDEMSNVMNEIKVNGKKLNSKDAYNAKVNTTKVLLGVINEIEVFKGNNVPDKRDFE